MSNIYLSNITDKMVINDLTKIIVASGVDLNDVETPGEKNWFSVEKMGESTYHVYTQKGLICYDVTITYDPVKVSLAALKACMFIPIAADLERCYEIELSGDVLKYSIVLQSATSSVEYSRFTYDERKTNGLQSSSLIDMVLYRFKEIIANGKVDSDEKMQLYGVDESMLRHERSYFEESFARACGIDVKAGTISECTNGSIMYSGETKKFKFYLRHREQGNVLDDFAISLVNKISDDTTISFDIGTDFENNLSLQTMIISKFNEEEDISSAQRHDLDKSTTWESIMDMVREMVADPQAAYDKYKKQESMEK